ncbi:MAG: type 4a pilus biogenesis protein PilO [Candidatus Omnitrophica bacterium]|nr:type 4a pilus biogenesis protein PilO [Candidatus Omnitrophota bacterium]MDD5546753.1 type 4a pilus biogenesis protein PilO [Candidatus Omnitrophota bacterium]
MPAPFNIPRIPKADLEKIVLIGIAGFIVVFSLIQFLMIPSFRKLSELRKDIIKETETLKKDEALIASKSQLQARLAAAQEKLKVYENAMPRYSEMPGILQKIAEVAYENKVKIIKVEPLRTEKAEPAKPKAAQAKPEAKKPASIYMEIPIQVEVKGGYHAIGQFINGVETAVNIMSIGDIEIKANPEDMQNHNARLLIVAYVLREETQSK